MSLSMTFIFKKNTGLFALKKKKKKKMVSVSVSNFR